MKICNICCRTLSAFKYNTELYNELTGCEAEYCDGDLIELEHDGELE